jgi:hypothetical protein
MAWASRQPRFGPDLGLYQHLRVSGVILDRMSGRERLRRRHLLLGAPALLARRDAQAQGAVPLFCSPAPPYVTTNGPGPAAAIAVELLSVLGLRAELRFVPPGQAGPAAAASPGAFAIGLRRHEIAAAGLEASVKLLAPPKGFGSLYALPPATLDEVRGPLALIARRRAPPGCTRTCFPYEEPAAAAAALRRGEVEAWWGEGPEMRHFLRDSPVPLLFARWGRPEELWLAANPAGAVATLGELEDARTLLEIEGAGVLDQLP